MTVAPFSEIFPPDIRYQCPRKALRTFERIAYLYETVDYRCNNLKQAQVLEANEKGWMQGTIPIPGNKGIQFGSDHEITQNHWSIFVFCTEFEGYLSEIIRFLNLSFYHLNKDFFEILIQESIFENKDLKRIDTIFRFVEFEKKLLKNEKENSKKLKALSLNPYNSVLKEAWNEWARYLSVLRNYVVHEAPIGGSIFSVKQIVSGESGYCSISLPTIESVSKYEYKKTTEDQFYALIAQDLQKGEYYDSKDIVDDYHPKIKELGKTLFKKEILEKAFWFHT